MNWLNFHVYYISSVVGGYREFPWYCTCLNLAATLYTCTVELVYIINNPETATSVLFNWSITLSAVFFYIFATQGIFLFLRCPCRRFPRSWYPHLHGQKTMRYFSCTYLIKLTIRIIVNCIVCLVPSVAVICRAAQISSVYHDVDVSAPTI